MHVTMGMNLFETSAGQAMKTFCSASADTMAEDKKITYPEFVVSTPETPEVKRSYKKYAIIAVSVVLVIVIVLTAILVGVYFFTAAQKDIVKFAYTRDDNSKEEVASDPNTNVVQYHVNNADYELWAFNDFNKDIQVLKIHYAGGTNCYAAPMNRTIALDPSKIVVPAGVNSQAPDVQYQMTYRAGNDPLKDTTFLCKAAKDACSGISTYWIYPSCEDPSEPKRAKRGWSLDLCVTFGWFNACLKF